MSITTSIGYSIKVYESKSNAESDTSALSINSAGVGEISSHEDDQYFVAFRRYWYRIEFREPVKGFYIDWDDGEDNSKEKANSQTVILDSPSHYGVVSHIYTKDGKFFPLVRSISMEGFWSKYHTSGNSSNTISNIEQLSISNIGEGEQRNSLLHLDSQTSPTLPYFYPTTLPPLGVLKVDRKTVYSGIYNELIESGLARRSLPTLVYVWYSAETSGYTIDKSIPVEITYESTEGQLKTTTLYTNFSANQNTYPTAIPDCWKILEAKLKYCTENSTTADNTTSLLHPDERVYLRMCHTSSIQSSTRPKLQNQTAPTGSLTDRVFINYNDDGTSIAHAQKILISGTANFNGKFTVTSNFAITSLSQDGARCTVTTSVPHGIPRGEVVTLGDCGAFTGDQTISGSGGTYDATHFNFLTSTTSVVSGGSARADTKNGFFIDLDISSGMPSAEADTGGWGAIDHDNDPVICSLSTGWPHHIFEERGFFTTIDASESRTRASNLTIPESRNNLWLDKGDFSFNNQTNNTDYATDILDASKNRMDTYRERYAYTLDPYVDNDFVGVRGVLDDRASGGDGRFIDDYRLLRLQVKDDRTESANNKFSYSKIESFNTNAYTAAGSTSKVYPSEVEETNLIAETINKGGAWDAGAMEENEAASTNLIELASATITSTPNNYILLAKSERKYDRIFIGVKNIHTTNLKNYSLGKCRISLQYPAKDPLTDGIKMKALPFTDYTRIPRPDTHSSSDPDFVSLGVNGALVFEAPDDWVKCKYNTSGVSWPSEVNLGNLSEWNFDSYALLISIGWEETPDIGGSGATSGHKPQIKYIYPYDNSHSEVIKVIDSHHVSLNDILITQSVSWQRRGKYINITDRIGRSEIRKIGSEGGSVRFGGIAHGDYSTSTTSGMTSYNLMKQYQQEGTPVYLDVQRPDGTYVRFFGKVTSLSEDVPTGRASNKWSVDMATEAVAEIAKDGTWLSDGLISLGGILDERPQFI